MFHKHVLQNKCIFLKGRTPLMKAAELGHVQALEILRTAKADATLRDIEGKGSLFNFSILMFLLAFFNEFLKMFCSIV